MTRYFPEVVEAIKANFPDRAVVTPAGQVTVAAWALNLDKYYDPTARDRMSMLFTKQLTSGSEIQVTNS